MTKKVKFSDDPKVKLITIEEFLSTYDYFKDGISKKHRWLDNTMPREDTTYFKIDKDKLVAVIYGHTLTNFGMEIDAKLELIQVARRDGKTEYESFDAEIDRLKNERKKFKQSKRLDDEILKTEKAKKKLPNYESNNDVVENKSFDDYLINTGYKISNYNFKEKYIVFDVETNGTRKSKDDLLSLSIYDPSTGICYNRYLPLDLQPVVLTGFVNGISEETLKCSTHITQDELDKIIEYFDLKNSILLSYSGGKGTFDSTFVINYCKRHNITGFENLKFKNIKEEVPQAPYGASGQLTKDNLCRMFQIDGVNSIHSGLNDCVLEWKLFEKLVEKPTFFIQNSLYRFNKEYVVPISYASKYPELFKHAGIQIPLIMGYHKKIFEYEFPKSALNSIRKFPTNITGITIENAINSLLNVKKQDNSRFLIENKKHLEFVGSLDNRIDEIPIITKDDGLIKTTDHQYDDYILEVNKVTKKIMSNLTPIIEFIKKNIFCNCDILSQELVISEDNKILALCDLSSKDNILEIKTTDIIEEDEYGCHILEYISQQLYYQSKGRNVYVLSVVFDKNYGFELLNSVSIKIFKVDLKKLDVTHKMKLKYFSSTILDVLIEDNSLTYDEISKKTGFSVRTVQNYVCELKNLGFIAREDKQNGVWRILKDLNGNAIPIDKQVKFKCRIVDYSDNYKKKIKEITDGQIICINYINSHTPVEYECLKCGHKWKIRPEHFMHRQKHGCPKCKAGRGK